MERSAISKQYKDVFHPKRETEGEIMGTGDEEEKK